ncbi:high-affinity Fe2+/Pb2+ permease [Leptolyngbyaceae cyanobacterium JSC-12]|nr:high-affinity Fe2+/Pb2+ permease [Leptolyngbyaceae cyanobacterium JSC-12]
MDWSPAIPTFLITLREGVEAALVVGIVLACLRQAKQFQLISYVYFGIVAGLGASVVVGGLLLQLLHQVQNVTTPSIVMMRQLLETGLSVLAIAMLSWMLIWMTRQARSLKAEIEGSVQSAVAGNGIAAWGIFSLIATAVLREGFETVLFVATQFQTGWTPLLGAIAGIVGAVIIGVLLFKWGIKINLKQFFQVMGTLLLLIVAGLVISALRHLDIAAIAFVQLHPQATSLCWSAPPTCLLGPLVWDAHAILPDKEFPGIILKTLFGYRQTLYMVQAIGYLLFLSVVGSLYFRSFNPVRTTSSKPDLALKNAE